MARRNNRRSGAQAMVCVAGLASCGGAVFAGPVTAYWSSAASASWNDASAWSTAPQYPNNGVPDGALYHAVIDATGGAYTVGFNTTAAIESLTLNSADATLHQVGGSLTLHGASAVQAGVYRLQDGTITGAGGLTVSSSLVFMDGTFSGAGALVIDDGGSFEIMQGGAKQLQRAVANYGTTILTSTHTLTFSTAQFVNYGLFEARAAQVYGSFSVLPVIVNRGEFRKTGADDAEFNVGFENEGLVHVQQGRLAIEGDHQAGEFIVDAGAILSLGVSGDIAPSASIHGAGELRIGGSVDHAGSTSVQSLRVGGGTVNFNNTVEAASITVHGGRGNFNAPLVLPETATLTVISDTFNYGANNPVFATGSLTLQGSTGPSVVTGEGVLSFAGSLAWSGGEMAGSGRTVIQEQAALSITNSILTRLGRVLENDGQTTWTGGVLRMRDGSFENDGVFTAHATNAILTSWGDSGTNLFLNRGEFIKTGANGAQFVHDVTGVTFQNTGVVEVRQGFLRFAGSAATTNEGTYATDHDASIEVAGAFANSSSATLAFEVGGMKERDLSGLMTITGEAALSGTLAVTTPEALSAAWGDQWTIMTFGSREGDFDVFDLPTEGFASWSDSFGASDLRWFAAASETDYIVGVSHIADIDHDGLIGFGDLNAIVSNFNAPGTWATGDVDGDGFVDFGDMNIVLSLFNIAAPRNVPAPGCAGLLELVGFGAMGRRR